MTTDPLTARRQAVATLLNQRGTLSYADRKALAAQFGCSPTMIYKDMQALQPPAHVQTPPILGLQGPPLLVQDRDAAILRLLGRLEFVPTPTIRALVAPDRTIVAVRERLTRLANEGRIWQQSATMAQVHPKEAGGRSLPPLRQPSIWGLTPEGLDLLRTMDAESDPATYETLQTRDRRAPKVPQAQLTHDLLVTSWCASVIDSARRSRLLDSVYGQVEYVSARTPDGKEQQRLDALVILVFNREPSPIPRPLWEIPWHTGTPPTRNQIVVRLALEVDRGTEPLKTLLAKGLTYRGLTESGHYKKTLGGDVLPVFLAPPGKRAAQIAREWQTSWPSGRGIISNFVKANHPTHGALWGEYYTMADTPPKTVSLLQGVFPDLTTWERMMTERIR